MSRDNLRELPPEQHELLLNTLKERFRRNMQRHSGIDWMAIQTKLEINPVKLWALLQMENTGGEPDVIDFNSADGEYLFIDCSSQSPAGRRSICYDSAGLAKREKEGLQPNGSAVGMAEAMNIDLLTEAQYLELQQLEPFDTKSSCWLKTPADIRQLGGALFAERRFGRVFISANTAPCFYQGRGFRGALKV